MTTDLATEELRRLALYDQEEAAEALQHIIATGDISRLKPSQRVAHYLQRCERLGLESTSRPFGFLAFDNGPLVMYINATGVAQLRRLHQISIRKVRDEQLVDLHVVEVQGTTPSGRTDFATKYVPLMKYDRQTGRYVKLAGKELANALMRAETGAKRRLVLSMTGESGLSADDDLPGGRVVVLDAHGNVIEHPSDADRLLAERPEIARAIGEPTFETTASAEDAPLPSTASQAVRAEEIARAMRPPGERPSFRASEQQVKQWLGAWFAAVRGTSLDDDEARHRFVAQWTAGEWPPNKRTDSLRTMFRRATEREAGDFLAHVRAVAESERQALLDDAATAREDAPAEDAPEEAPW